MQLLYLHIDYSNIINTISVHLYEKIEFNIKIKFLNIILLIQNINLAIDNIIMKTNKSY